MKLNEGVFWYPEFKGLELFFCFDQSDPKASSLFNWKGIKGKTVSWVQSIERGTTLSFKKGESQHPQNRQLQALLSWTQKWPNGAPFEPSKHCKIEKLNSNYKLTCNTPIGSSQHYEWVKDISKSMVETPNMTLQEQI